ncbi:MAG: methyltransferase family protein [Acidobacteriaceae bacterium]
MKTNWNRIARRIRVPLGFAFAIFFLWIAQPSPASLGWSLLLVLPGIALRAYASGYVKKNRELTVTGPYAHTRNPLYLGSLSIALGFAVAARNGWVLTGIAILFFAIYLPVIRSEEEFLRGMFPGFDDYCRRVPRLLPRLTPGMQGEAGKFSAALYSRHREYNAVMGAMALYAALLLRLYFRR